MQPSPIEIWKKRLSKADNKIDFYRFPRDRHFHIALFKSIEESFEFRLETKGKTQTKKPSFHPVSPSPPGGYALSDTGGLKHADNVAFKGRFCKPPELGAKFLRKVRRFAKNFQNRHVSPRNHYSPEQTFSSTFFWRNETVVFFGAEVVLRDSRWTGLCNLWRTPIAFSSTFPSFVTDTYNFAPELLAYISKEEVNVKYTSAFVSESFVNVPLSSDYITKSSVNAAHAPECVPLTEDNVTDALVSVPLTEVFVTLPEKYFT